MSGAPRLALRSCWPLPESPLPLKILTWEDSHGKVWVSYNSPTYLQERHGIPEELVQNIAVAETLGRVRIQFAGGGGTLVPNATFRSPPLKG
jgi:hypothetical protein